MPPVLCPGSRPVPGPCVSREALPLFILRGEAKTRRHLAAHMIPGTPPRAAARARQGRPTKPRTSPFRHWLRLSRSPLTRATTAAKTLGIQGLHDAHRDVRDTQPERRQGHEDLRVQGPVGRRNARAPRARRLRRRLARRAGAPRGRRVLGALRHPHREPLRRAQPERVVRLRGRQQHASRGRLPRRQRTRRVHGRVRHQRLLHVPALRVHLGVLRRVRGRRRGGVR